MQNMENKKMTAANNNRTVFLLTDVPKTMVIINAVLAILYFVTIVFFFEQGNPVLFWLLVLGEVFHVWQLVTFLYTIYDTKYRSKFADSYLPPIDIFITVAGEPVSIVEATARAARDMDYPNFRVYILNDGLVAKKDNYREIEELALRLGVGCITRTVPGGAKAGNINHALRQTISPFFAVLDTDHVPHRDFLRKMVGYFIDPKMAFVQAPQFYKNFSENLVTQGAWEQQALFFGPICMGKNRLNAVTMCGTNMVVRRKALEEIGYMCEDSVAEDLITGMLMHERGWKSAYVPEVVSEGLAPEDFLSYYKQQHRWARGIMDMIFRYNFLFRRGLSLAQRIQYLSSASFYFSGVVVVMNALLPIIFFFTGAVAIHTSTMLLATVFLPYIIFTLYVLQLSSNYSYSFRSLAFSMAGFNIHLSALWSAISGKKIAFAITSKKKLEGNFVRLVAPQIAYIGLALFGSVFAILRDGLLPSVLTNIAWAFLNVAIFSEYILAAVPSLLGERTGAGYVPERRSIRDIRRDMPIRQEKEMLPALG